MLLSGTRGASHTCLRCQLRQAIFLSRTRCLDRSNTTAERYFSATPQRQDQEDDTTISKSRRRDDRPYVYHHPLGRIVGAPGRKQRQGTQKLKIDAMKKPFEVIIMQDMRQPKEEERPLLRKLQEGSAVNIAEIESEMATEGQDPSQDEVNQAIDAFRPDEPLLDEEQYKALAASLSKGFTPEQLRLYFIQSLNLSAVPGDTVHLVRERAREDQSGYQRMPWRRGRTPLEKPLTNGTVFRKSERTSKPKVIENILRLSWSLAFHAEEQKIGELELSVRSGDLIYLFDLKAEPTKANSGMMYEDIIESPLLLRSCKLDPYRPQGRLRITGRRQDAEEVANRLHQRLLQVKRDTIQLKVFSSLLGTPGWPTTLGELFRREDLAYIQRRSQTVIEQSEQGVLSIYGTVKHHREMARRLILELLELPFPGSTTVVPFQSDASISKAKPGDKATLLPEIAGMGLHLRHRNLELTRLTFPSKAVDVFRGRKLQGVLRLSLDSAVASVSKVLNEHKSPSHLNFASCADTYWTRGSRVPRWKAQICRILHGVRNNNGFAHREQTAKGSSTNASTVVNAQIPNLDRLLSFFKPRQVQSDLRPSLTAHLVPSPFAAQGMQVIKNLPSVGLRYKFTQSTDGTPDIWLFGAKAMVRKETIRIPLPSDTVDVQLERRTGMSATGIRVLRDEHIKEFTEKLRRSLQQVNAPLSGTYSLWIKLPAAVMRAAGSGGNALDYTTDNSAPDAEVEYLLTGFEQVTPQEYIPVDAEDLPKNLDAETRQLLTSFKDGLFLQVKDVAAGRIGGKRTEVSVQSTHLFTLRDVPMPDEIQGEVDRSLEQSPANPEASDSVQKKSNKQRIREADPDADTPHVVRASLGLARLITKLSTGEVQPMQYHDPHADAVNEESELEGFEGDAFDKAAASGS